MRPLPITINLKSELHYFFLAFFETLQDKLAQLRDAREALNALRDEHKERIRQKEAEIERQRYLQMMQKLEFMRQKKHVSFCQLLISTHAYKMEVFAYII